MTITSGVVTAILSGDGYWIQDGTGPWSGIFVYDNVNTPTIGDSITIEGSVDENFGATQIDMITSYVVEPAPSIIPAPTSVNTVDVQTQEEWEGVLLNITNATCTNINAGFGMWVVNNGSNTTDTLLVDDDIYSYSPTLNTIYGITGIGHYSFGDYKILPRDINDIVGAVPPPAVSIYDIQYTTDPNGDSPENGNVVTTSGIVTGITGGGQFFIQDGDGLWNGLYIFENGTNVARGDMVEVTGTIDEFNGLTEMVSVTNVTIISSGNAEPNIYDLPSNAGFNTEAVEGVLIFAEGECIDNTEGFGLWTINDLTNNVKMDDDIFAYANTSVIGNYYEVTGIGHYSFSEYKLLPRDIDDINITGFSGIENHSTKIKAYPNPAKDQLTISGITNAYLTIYNVAGAKVFQTNIINNQVLDIASLQTGIYIIEIVESDVKSTLQLTIE